MVESQSNTHYLACYVVPAVFQYKSNPNYKYHSDFISVMKAGYVVFDFIEGEEMGQALAKRK